MNSIQKAQHIKISLSYGPFYSVNQSSVSSSAFQRNDAHEVSW